MQIGGKGKRGEGWSWNLIKLPTFSLHVESTWENGRSLCEKHELRLYLFQRESFARNNKVAGAQASRWRSFYETLVGLT